MKTQEVVSTENVVLFNRQRQPIIIYQQLELYRKPRQRGGM